MNLKQRLDAFRETMEQQDIDLSIVMNFENQMYFTGFKAVIYSRPIILFISQENIEVIAPKLEEAHFRDKTGIQDIYTYTEIPVEDDVPTRYQTVFNDLLEKHQDAKTVGIETGFLPTQFYLDIVNHDFKVKDISQALVEQRTYKYEDEQQAIRESGEIVSQAVAQTIEHAKAGLTEMDIDNFGNSYLFDTISQNYPDAEFGFFVMSPSGIKRSTMPHTFSNTKQIQQGDVIVHSRQLELNGYRAECERTFFVGEPTEEQRHAFEAMVEAHKAALDFIEVGVTANAVDQVARTILEAEGYGDYISHRTGHGIGIGQHEEPSLRFDNELELKEGMVFCVEPGIYIPGVGGFRHSDTVILKKEGTEVVTNYPHDLEDLIK